MKKVLTVLIFGVIFLINPLVMSCTVFHASNDEYAFGGNNEDWNDSDTYIYFIPPDGNEYGKAIVGYSGNYWIQGGMNEKGLFWDGLATPYLEVVNSSDKPYFNGHILDYILSVCDSCDEALDILNMYNMRILERAQILCGDQYGDSFIIEGDVVHRKTDYYQVATNFYLSQHPNPPYPCWRYNTALNMFNNDAAENLSLDFCVSILDACHQEGSYPTQYSTVYDLKNKLIYIYHNHNYNKVKVFNLTEELKLGHHSYSIPELFEDSNPPSKPSITGPPLGKINEEHIYSFVSTDPDGDEISYYIEWGDSTYTGWTRTIPSGGSLNTSHIWNQKDSYTIMAKAKDTYGAESDWTTLEVSMAKNKAVNGPFFRFLERLMERFPILEKLLQLTYD